MELNIKLVFFKGCPNVEEVRKNINEAIIELELGLKQIKIEEIDTSKEGSSQELRELKGFPSPTILINNIDMDTGKPEPQGESGCCRFGKAQEVGLIKEAIIKYGNL